MAEPNGKKAAIIGALLTGESVSKLAEEFGISRTTIYRWKKESPELQNVTQKNIGDLLLEYLQESLITLKEQAAFFRDPDWLDKQEAADVAVLHGVMSDKSYRMLEALSKDDND